jgi:hypothetical protein
MELLNCPSESSLVSALSKQNRIIIYGAGGRARVVAERLRALGNTCETVFAVSDTSDNTADINGMPVRGIYEMAAIAISSPIVIAVHTEYQEEIIAKLCSLNCRLVIPVSEALWSEILSNSRQNSIEQSLHAIKTSIEQSLHVMKTSIEEQSILSFQDRHQKHLDNLRKKIRDAQKVKVVFLVTAISKFCFASIYRNMQEDVSFEPVIYMFDEYIYDDYTKDKSTIARDVESLRERGFNVVWDFDISTAFSGICALQPDIVFYNAPYLGGNPFSSNFIKALSFEYLTCYVPYGALTHDCIEYVYTNASILTAWKSFRDTEYSFFNYIRYSCAAHINGVLSGYPKIDDVVARSKYSIRPGKGDKKTIIYAPHHSIMIEKTNNFSALRTGTFHIYSSLMMRLANENPNMNFIFKPHPTLRDRLVQLELAEIDCITPTEYDIYCEKWNGLSNGKVITNDDYLSIFNDANCLITDCGSFIIEWLATNKPCLYLASENKPSFYQQFADFVVDILDTYYLCDSEALLLKIFDDVVVKEKDEKFDRRTEQLHKVIFNLGHAGEFIVNHIKSELDLS